ncbi:MAG TPA: hypothetical protein VGZ22_31670 [Isosphaeraceae bacterium]|jgi:hypothetical protein|nr:hypothetical protein [Isosphaeraceae bacterium]
MSLASPTDPKREFLRHTVATLAYRGEKALRGAPEGFATQRVCETSRSAVEILAHIGDVLQWGLCLSKGQHAWHPEAPRSWEAEVGRFFDVLRQLDEYLASDAPLGSSVEMLFQGPIADALTHVGQIATLRRLAGAPVRGENYFRAEILAGRVGPDQSSKRVEFD